MIMSTVISARYRSREVDLNLVRYSDRRQSYRKIPPYRTVQYRIVKKRAMWDGYVRLIHLAMSGARNSGISTGRLLEGCGARVQKYPKVAKSTQVLIFCEGACFSAYLGGYGGSSVFFVWIVGGSGPLGPDGRNFSSLYQFLI